MLVEEVQDSTSSSDLSLTPAYEGDTELIQLALCELGFTRNLAKERRVGSKEQRRRR